MPRDRVELLAQVASLYYEQGRSQEEIAREVGCSRSAVSRFLSEARQRGIVEIIIHRPVRTSPEIARQLCERFGLRDAHVLVRGESTDAEALRFLGQVGARVLTELLDRLVDGVVGIGWGTAIYEVVRALRSPQPRPGLQVVQMIGALGTGDPMIDGPELARLLAERLGARYRYLHAPLLVESEAVRLALLQERNIRETMELAAQAHVALVGIGSVVPQVSSLIRAGYLTEGQLSEVAAHGAVGDICARHFDSHGRILDLPINRRIVGIDISVLHRIPWVVGVAGGLAKAPAILGALRGRHVNVLITDDAAAREVLHLEEMAAAEPSLTQA